MNVVGLRRLARALTCSTALCVVGACEVPTPLAPAEPIGEVPKWGEGFATPEQQPNSMLGANDPAPDADPSGAPKSPGPTGDWGGGNARLGKPLFDQLCARCHGVRGEGGTLPDGATAPAFSDAAWQGRMTDAQIAKAIALGKGAMPAFAQDLDKEKLRGIVAHIRTLKY